MVDVPMDTVVTTPEGSIVATPVLSLIQAPPGVASERVVVRPEHKPSDPVMDAGKEFTDTVVIEAQLAGEV